MSLILDQDLTQLSEDVRSVLEDQQAALQTWAGKREGDGRWVDVEYSDGDLRVNGNGNSWAVSIAARDPEDSRLSFRLVGTSMLMNFWYTNTVLTIVSATNGLYIRVPAGFKIAGRTSLTTARNYYSGGYLVDNAVTMGMSISATAGQRYVAIVRADGGNFVGPGITLGGQIEFEVERIL